ncbi:MAG TPA: hypothetical protein VGX28_07010 [Frankiaceae bacterium]|jgi:hypothetical protein|nr:hypothetical protein [Frankiaceae bacterium]
MAQGQTEVTSNLFYDLVSIQYHALKGQELYQRFAKDAQGHQEITTFFEELREQDIQRAQRCHQLLAQISGDGTGAGTWGGGTAEPYPTDQQQGQTTGAGIGG